MWYNLIYFNKFSFSWKLIFSARLLLFSIDLCHLLQPLYKSLITYSKREATCHWGIGWENWMSLWSKPAIFGWPLLNKCHLNLLTESGTLSFLHPLLNVDSFSLDPLSDLSTMMVFTLQGLKPDSFSYFPDANIFLWPLTTESFFSSQCNSLYNFTSQHLPWFLCSPQCCKELLDPFVALWRRRKTVFLLNMPHGHFYSNADIKYLAGKSPLDI